MEYFYTSPDNIKPDSLTIYNGEFSHLTHVMRKTAGDAIRVVDGAGNAYDVTVEKVEKRAAVCSIQSRHQRLHEPELDVTIAVGLLKNHSKFDFLVEKCTELGVSSIIPLITERTIPHHAKTERWQKLALAAMKQSGRCVLPEVQEPKHFNAYLSSIPPPSFKIIPHEKVESPTIREALRSNVSKSIIICIGPEGGFTEEEIVQAKQNGFIVVGLGTRRLRTETAAIIAAAITLS